MGKTMVTDGLPHGKSHSISGVTFSLKVAEEALEPLVDGVRVGVLSFDLGQEALQELTVSVEEDNLNPELCPHPAKTNFDSQGLKGQGGEEKGFVLKEN